ncbi:hypothetical protein L1D34_22985 [Vibrio mediterranei]|uniref:hypothetical protein n=1 Tax=Vibrio mediterranei TaxID=689 RepID=UPI001EFE9A81|nr:hypothetical protein [Vibrio mediterranei]MCG9627705.1 hypothetical protein [Vibrio mediterranei]
MGSLFRFVLIANISSGIVVCLAGYIFPMLNTSELSDFTFYIAIVLWGVAGLAWDGGRISRTYDVDVVSQKMKAMVKEYNLEAEKHKHYRQNYSFGFSLFVAGVFPLLLSAVLTWLN